jgi:hypothetical protein
MYVAAPIDATNAYTCQLIVDSSFAINVYNVVDVEAHG